MIEFDYLLNVGLSGIDSYDGIEALSNNIKEWLNTPTGSMMDNPAWGNNIRSFHFLPQSNDLTTAISMHIAEKLPQDVLGASITSVSVKFLESDLMEVGVIANGIDVIERIGGVKN